MTPPYAELRGDTILVHGRTGSAEIATTDGPKLIEWLQEILSDDADPDPTDGSGDNDPDW